MNDHRLTDQLAREEGSIVALALLMAVLFAACFALIHVPGMPAHIQEALTCLPS
jgi:hypothetical protein